MSDDAPTYLLVTSPRGTVHARESGRHRRALCGQLVAPLAGLGVTTRPGWTLHDTITDGSEVTCGGCREVLDHTS